MWLEYYLMGIILIPGILFALVAQIKVKTSYKKYSQVMSERNLTGAQVARLILDSAGLNSVKVQKIDGELTDNFDSKTNIVSLSAGVYDSTSVAAIGIASHEVGHALQYGTEYTPIKIRMFMVGMCNFSSKILWPLVLIGLLLNAGLDSVFGQVCMWAGVGFFGISLLFNLITLPVEYNASRRAKSILSNSGILNSSEMEGVSAVLNSAALTYVAALIISLLNLIRFLIVMRHRD